MSDFLCQKLAKGHDRDSFQCGVPELDRYLRRQASQDLRKKVAAVFVLAPKDNPKRIAGYYTLSAASIQLQELPQDLIKHLPRYPAIPSVLIGRLARDVNYPGAGKLLLLDALSRAKRHSADVASAVVLVDAKSQSARDFYVRFGFNSVLRTPTRLFLPMKAITVA
jgi:hypothetical protein